MHDGGFARRRWTLVAIGVSILAAVVGTWPLATALGDAVPTPQWHCLGRGCEDEFLCVWIVSSLAKRLLHDPLTLFEGGILHPLRHTLAYSETMLSAVAVAAPVTWLTGNHVLGYDLDYLGTVALSVLGTFLLVRDVTGDPRAALVAGLLFGLTGERWNDRGHLPKVSVQWIPSCSGRGSASSIDPGGNAAPRSPPRCSRTSTRASTRGCCCRCSSSRGRWRSWPRDAGRSAAGPRASPCSPSRSRPAPSSTGPSRSSPRSCRSRPRARAPRSRTAGAGTWRRSRTPPRTCNASARPIGRSRRSARFHCSCSRSVRSRRYGAGPTTQRRRTSARISWRRSRSWSRPRR